MPSRIMCALLLMAAGACYSERAVGVSKGEAPVAPAPAKPKFPTRILAPPGQMVSFASPRAGDLDGDGLDDFVLWGREMLENGEVDSNNQSLYLFYGRTEFPLQLSTADADAVFKVAFSEPSGPAGDLNGDGLSDLLLVRTDSVEFIFGSKRRLHGAIAPNSAGAVWMAGELSPPFAAGFSTQFMVQRAGDLDGDGCADLIVGATAMINPEPDGTGGGLITRAHLIRGYRGEWKSAVWDPRWAAAGFGFDSGKLDGSELFEPSLQSLIYPMPAGDLDGDGRGELLATTAVGSLLFYGRREYARELTSSEADARLLPSADSNGGELTTDGQPWFFGGAEGDLDGDGVDDLAFVDPNGNALGFAYGQRWSGDVQLTPELTLEFERPGQQSIEHVVIGDIDGDGLPELLVNVFGLWGSADAAGELTHASDPATAIYVLRGIGERLVGRIRLTADYRWSLPPEVRGTLRPGGPEPMLELSLAGDIDGDGGQDVLTNSYTTNETGQPELSMYLVPSTPRSPD